MGYAYPGVRPRPQKITFAEMRDMGACGLLRGLSLQPFDRGQRSSLARRTMAVRSEPRFICHTCGKRGTAA
jgi:hypothetical protein